MLHRIRAANFSSSAMLAAASMNSTMRSPETRVGAIPTIAPYVLPELVKKFHKDYPEVTLELVEDVTDGITRRVKPESSMWRWHPLASKVQVCDANR
jgi:Transcriptional regulator